MNARHLGQAVVFSVSFAVLSLALHLRDILRPRAA